MLNEMSEKKSTVWYHLYVKSKKCYKWPDLQNRNRITDSENKFIVTKGESKGRERIN